MNCFPIQKVSSQGGKTSPLTKKFPPQSSPINAHTGECQYNVPIIISLPINKELIS